MPQTKTQKKTEKKIIKEFRKLEWPMNLAGTGVDLEMFERDKQIEEFILQALSSQKQEIIEMIEDLVARQKIVPMKRQWNSLDYENGQKFMREKIRRCILSKLKD